MSGWFVYILRCADDSLYTGITTDVERRVKEHNGDIAKAGAKCTRARRPVTLVYQEEASDRSCASKREIQIKALTRAKKITLIQGLPDKALQLTNRKKTGAC